MKTIVYEKNYRGGGEYLGKYFRNNKLFSLNHVKISDHRTTRQTNKWRVACNEAKHRKVLVTSFRRNHLTILR